jgi:hypothetical protein
MYRKIKNKNLTKMKIKPQDLIIPRYFCILDFQYHNKEVNNNNKMIEVEKLGNYLIFLTQEGSILLYNTHHHKDIITSLNNSVNSRLFGTNSEHKAKSLYVNKLRKTLLIVYLSKAQNFLEMNCCEVTLESLKELILFNANNENLPVFNTYFKKKFENENFSGNGYIEYDELNNKILTKDAHSVFKVWDLKDYGFLFRICDSRINEIRVTLGSIMTIELENNIIKLNTFEVNSGNQIINFDIKISKDYCIEILEIFETILLIKQEIFKPVLFNLETHDYHMIEKDCFSVNSYFIYNYKTKIIIAINECNVQLFNIQGEVIRILDRVIKSLVEDYVFCSQDLKYLFLYYSSKIPPEDLNKSFIVERTEKNEIDSFPSKKSRVLYKSINKERDCYSPTSIGKFLNSNSRSKISQMSNNMERRGLTLEESNRSKLPTNIGKI